MVVRAPDGAALATDVRLPDQVPGPIVVARTPYDRRAFETEARGWTRHGFGFVCQDVRGRYGSEGQWNPYAHERIDGAALVSWVREQPWCAALFAYGASYGAFTAWEMAAAIPGAVDGVISMVPAMGMRAVKFEPSGTEPLGTEPLSTEPLSTGADGNGPGVLRLAEHVSWWIEHGDTRESRTGCAAATFASSPGLLGRLPVTSLGDAISGGISSGTGSEVGCGDGLPGLWDVLDPPASDPQSPDPQAPDGPPISGLPMPSLHIGGLRDLLLPMTLRHWEVARHGSLILGPWGHELAALGRRQIAWMRSVLGGSAPRTTEATSTGTPWTTSWPPAVGQQGLEIAIDATYVNDPLHPFPSRELGVDRRALDGRADAGRATLPVRGGVHLSGVPLVSLDAETDAVSVDWIVRLVERSPSGSVLELAHGLAVDDPARIPLTPVHHGTAPGATLELEVSSSDFPRLARNLGTGRDRYTTTSTVTSRQRVRSARVFLPVVEEVLWSN